jgi:hypothetical protein
VSKSICFVPKSPISDEEKFSRLASPQNSTRRSRPYLPQSTSASRFIAGAFGFFDLIQCNDRPEV